MWKAALLNDFIAVHRRRSRTRSKRDLYFISWHKCETAGAVHELQIMPRPWHMKSQEDAAGGVGLASSSQSRNSFNRLMTSCDLKLWILTNKHVRPTRCCANKRLWDRNFVEDEMKARGRSIWDSLKVWYADFLWSAFQAKIYLNGSPLSSHINLSLSLPIHPPFSSPLLNPSSLHFSYSYIFCEVKWIGFQSGWLASFDSIMSFCAFIALKRTSQRSDNYVSGFMSMSFVSLLFLIYSFFYFSS